jgi:predicted Na+-dependent transporter
VISAAERRVLGGALVLAAAVGVGLSLGAAFSPPGLAGSLAIPALGLQTLMTVGALPRRDPSAALRPGLTLLGLHLVIASAPMLALGLVIGLDDPIGLGLFLIGAAPPAALIPAFADVAEVRGGELLAFVLMAYGLSLVLTPLLVLLAAGEAAGIGRIALTLCAGLIGPAVLARVLHDRIVAIPQRVRRGIVNTCVLAICFGLGEGFADIEAGIGMLALVAAALLLRSFGGAALAERVAPRALRAEAPFAVAFKNVALAAAVGGSVASTEAAVPGLVGFGVETLCFLWVARRSARGQARPARGTRRSGRPR